MLNSNFESIDGNGNCYKIQTKEKTNIEYNPIKPITSSSGIYDGGHYFKKELTLMQLNEVLKLIEKIVATESYKMDRRIKGSGMIIRDKDGIKETFIIDPKCPELKRLEVYLQEI